jgi:hypothetical protein
MASSFPPPMNSTQYLNMMDYLKTLYAQPFFERNGVTYPVVVDYPDEDTANAPDKLLGKYRTDMMGPADFAFYDYAYLHTLQNRHHHLYNGVTFILDQIKRKPLRLNVRLGRYYDMLATCGALQNELEAAAIHRFMRLPGRTQLHRRLDPQESLLRGQARSAAVGIAVLVVFYDGETYKAIIAQRGTGNATDSGRYHVMPAFIFQPRTQDVEEYEWSIEHHIWREYLEELFGLPEDSDDWQNHPAYTDIQARLKAGTASLHLTGMVTNVMTLRPEICTLLLIRDADWYERITDPQSDIYLNAHAEAHEGQVQLINILTNALMASSLPADIHLRMAPQGAVALWLGSDLARQLILQDPVDG